MTSFRGTFGEWALVLLAVVIAAYVRAYYSCPTTELIVAQTDLAGCGDAVLLERRPLVIVDRLADHSELLTRSTLRLLHIRADPPRPVASVDGQHPHVASARFTLVYQSHADATHVELRHPTTGAGVAVVLRRHQTLVLPPRWRFACPDGATVRELHDTVSLILRLVGVTRRPSMPPMQSMQSMQPTPGAEPTR